jgi:hypothetical protein
MVPVRAIRLSIRDEAVPLDVTHRVHDHGGELGTPGFVPCVARHDRNFGDHLRALPRERILALGACGIAWREYRHDRSSQGPKQRASAPAHPP